MPISEDIQRAAQELGQALNQTPAMQRYLAAAELAAQDENLCALEASLAELYTQLSARERDGQVLLRAEINHYHNLREQVRQHPLYAAREAALREVKVTFARASETLSSVLTVDFTGLALEE
jgi:cell fate (sporulation/competence/biofilm development) regulator YlbF (YheA/YmcA/DUF963 family)